MSETATPPFPSIELNRCPFDFYEHGRSSVPVEKVPERNEVRLYRHEDIAFVLQHEELFSAYIPTAHTSRGLISVARFTSERMTESATRRTGT
jgi:hypothetical protein